MTGGLWAKRVSMNEYIHTFYCMDNTHVNTENLFLSHRSS